MGRTQENLAAALFGSVVAAVAGVGILKFAPNDGSITYSIVNALMMPGTLIALILTPGGVHGDIDAFLAVALVTTAIFVALLTKLAIFLVRRATAR